MSHEPPPPAPSGGSLPALRHRDYRLYWVGDGLSTAGAQFTAVASAWQIYELTDSALQIGLLGLAQALPQMLLLVFGGLLADAVDRRKLMIATQLVLGCVALVLFAATALGAISPALLYVASALLGAATSVDTPARQTLITNLVPRTELTNALALTNAQRRIAQIAGPSLAGVALAITGPWLCYAVDALSRLAMVGALLLVHARSHTAGGRQAMSVQSLREGVAFVWSHPAIMTLMLLDFGMNFFGSPQALLPIYARDILVVGPQGLGILHAATAAGSLVAAVFLSLRGQVRRVGFLTILGVTIYGAATTIFAVSHTFWLSILMLATAGAGNTIGVIMRQTINQLSAPDELRGRVTAVNGIFTSGGPRLGQFESGLTASWWGAEASALVGGLLALALAVLALLPPHVRNLDIVAGHPTDRRAPQPATSTNPDPHPTSEQPAR